MNLARRKEILEEWKHRHPEMGVISFRCKDTGDLFFGTSTDTRADYNSNRFKLSMGNHPNKKMQALWNQYGEDKFDYEVVKVLKYEDANEDHTDELEELRESCFAANPQAGKIWR